MKLEHFRNRQPRLIGEDKLRQYAVLVPLVELTGVTYLLFEKRSNKLRRQPGEICFPGGKLELLETMEECAVRETMEELLLERNQIEVLGPSDVYLSPFNLKIQPFIGVIHNYKDSYSKDEVDEIIKVPVKELLIQKPKVFESQLINEPHKDFPYEMIPGGNKYPWSKGKYDILFYQYKDWIIWGLTAQIAESALHLMEEYEII